MEVSALRNVAPLSAPQLIRSPVGVLYRPQPSLFSAVLLTQVPMIHVCLNLSACVPTQHLITEAYSFRQKDHLRQHQLHQPLLQPLNHLQLPQLLQGHSCEQVKRGPASGRPSERPSSRRFRKTGTTTHRGAPETVAVISSNSILL